MAVNCDPAELAVLARAFQGLDGRSVEAVKTYLLAQIAGSNLTPAELAAAAKCYCFDESTQRKVQSYLLCQIANQ